MQKNKWKLEGYDTFSPEEYAVPGDYDTEEDTVLPPLLNGWTI